MLEQDEDESAAEERRGSSQLRRNVAKDDAVAGDNQRSCGQHLPQAPALQDLPHGAVAKV
jgi:hypothetical protein